MLIKNERAGAETHLELPPQVERGAGCSVSSWSWPAHNLAINNNTKSELAKSVGNETQPNRKFMWHEQDSTECGSAPMGQGQGKGQHGVGLNESCCY